jgi:putative ABC transport system substrate-binding protein
MNRRELIGGFASAAAWPVVAQAQQSERVRQIGVLVADEEDDPETKVWISGLVQGLRGLGWIVGRNLRMQVRGAAGHVERMRMFAKELVEFQPDVIIGTYRVFAADGGLLSGVDRR